MLVIILTMYAVQMRRASSTSACLPGIRDSTMRGCVSTGSRSSAVTGGWWSGAGPGPSSVLVTSAWRSMTAAGGLI